MPLINKSHKSGRFTPPSIFCLLLLLQLAAMFSATLARSQTIGYCRDDVLADPYGTATECQSSNGAQHVALCSPITGACPATPMVLLSPQVEADVASIEATQQRIDKATDLAVQQLNRVATPTEQSAFDIASIEATQQRIDKAIDLAVQQLNRVATPTEQSAFDVASIEATAQRLDQHGSSTKIATEQTATSAQQIFAKLAELDSKLQTVADWINAGSQVFEPATKTSQARGSIPATPTAYTMTSTSDYYCYEVPASATEWHCENDGTISVYWAASPSLVAAATVTTSGATKGHFVLPGYGITRRQQGVYVCGRVATAQTIYNWTCSHDY